MFPCVNLLVSLQTNIQDRRGREERDVIYDSHLETRCNNSSFISGAWSDNNWDRPGDRYQLKKEKHNIPCRTMKYYLLSSIPASEKTEMYFSYRLEKNIGKILKSVSNCFNTGSAKILLPGSLLYFFHQKVFKVIWIFISFGISFWMCSVAFESLSRLITSWVFSL